MLGSANGENLVVEAVGEDEAAAVEALVKLIDARFNEQE